MSRHSLGIIISGIFCSHAIIGLAMVTALVLIKDFWQAVLVVGLLAFLVMLVVQNLAEPRRS